MTKRGPGQATLQSRKLIEVSLPLEAINRESSREKYIGERRSTLHHWWSRKPLAACRSILFASLVDDPSSYIQSANRAREERERLLNLIARLVSWDEASQASQSSVFMEAKLEIARSIARAAGVPLSAKPSPAEIQSILDKHAPPIIDPFCGAGSISIEAVRLGLRTCASELNPVAVLITKALIEIPRAFLGKPSVHPEVQKTLRVEAWTGPAGLAEDVAFYGERMGHEARELVGHLYPSCALPRGLGGREATVIAWLFCRTMECPNPVCGGEIPLASKFGLSNKKGREAWAVPVLDKKRKTVEFEVKDSDGSSSDGTVSRRGARCLFCHSSFGLDDVRASSKAKGLGIRMMAIVADTPRGRVFLPPNDYQSKIALSPKAQSAPMEELADNPRYVSPPLYGIRRFADLFTPRQLFTLVTFCNLVPKVRDWVLKDAMAAGMEEGNSLSGGGSGARAYSEAVSIYLALAVDRAADYWNTLAAWDKVNVKASHLFVRQAFPMIWDFVESNPFGGSVGDWSGTVRWISQCLANVPTSGLGTCRQLDASNLPVENATGLVCTDPPYFDNIGYADLADFFYIWLRRSVAQVYPDLFSTVLTPKGRELVAVPYRFGRDRRAAERFFRQGLSQVFSRLREAQDPRYPLVLFYAFKQAESGDEGEIKTSAISTGWESMLSGLMQSGFEITGTWPIRTEMKSRQVAIGVSSLASSIVLVCRPRPPRASMATHREFVAALKSELPSALQLLRQGSVAPVDLAQATIGPGMRVFSRFERVLMANGTAMDVRTGLQIINQELESILREEETESDPETQFCISWFEQHGLSAGPFGDAEVLSKAKNTSIGGLVRSDVLMNRGGMVALAARSAYPTDWNPSSSGRVTLWECTQQLVKSYVEGGETAAAALAALLGPGRSEDAKTLAYRLYTICERKGWSEEALAYNEFVVAWPEILKKAAAITGEGPQKTFDVEEKE